MCSSPGLLGRIQLHSIVPEGRLLPHLDIPITWPVINNFFSVSNYVYRQQVSHSEFLERLYKFTFTIFKDSKCIPTLPKWIK